MSELEMILPMKEMPDEVIEQAMGKDFKVKDGSTIDDILKKPKNKNTRVTKASLRNLRQYSDDEVSEESKRSSTKNLRAYPNASASPSMSMAKGEIEFPPSIRNPEIIRNCLTKDEIIFFIDRWTVYYKEYGDDLNDATDYDQLLELIMNYIDLYRIQKKKKNSEKAVTDPAIADIQHKTSNRIQALLTSLKTRRKDRVEMNMHKEDNLMKILCETARQSTDAAIMITNRVLKESSEEKKFLEHKRNRGNILE